MGMKRILSSVILIPILYLIVWYLPPGYFVILVVAAAVMGQSEFYQMAQGRVTRPLMVLGMILGGLLVVLMAIPGKQGMLYMALCLLLVMLARLFSSRPVDGAMEDMAITFLGVFYVAMLFGFQVAIRRMSADGKYWLVFMYLVIWASDTGAYYAGTNLGRHKLYPKISPQKSVEGLIGGVLAAMAAALLCRVWFLPVLTVKEATLLGFILVVAGTLGDFVESLLKRSAGVKDSGNIIPGHGGMLDRMDSMLFAAPVLYYYLGMR